jgi:hypothetical protein
MDIRNNVKFSEDYEAWELPKVMHSIEDKLNAARIEQSQLNAEVAVRYRDANGAWYASVCWIEYRKDQNKIAFGATRHIKCGTKKPELPECIAFCTNRR